MPTVGKKKFPYNKKGEEAAEEEAKKKGKKVVKKKGAKKLPPWLSKGKDSGSK